MENNLTNEQGGNLKKCPLCAETIPLEAVTCEFCGARFEVTRTGYCQICHDVRKADGNGQCKVCGNAVVDLRVESKIVEEPIQKPLPESQPIAQTELTKTRKSRLPISILAGILVSVAIASIIWLGRKSLPVVSSLFATSTPTATPTIPPTITPVPSPTNTPEPTLAPSDVVVPIEDMAKSIPWLPLDTNAVPGVVWIGFNINDPPFNNPLVRQAFAASLDRLTLAKIATDHGEKNVMPATSFTPPEILGRDLYGKVGIPFNLNLARTLLAQAGYSNGASFPKVTIYTNSTEIYEPLFNAIVQMWQSHLNINITVEFLDRTGYTNWIINNNPDMFRQWWFADFNDPDNFLQIFHSGGGYNLPEFSNPKFDQLIDQASLTTDPAKRQELYILAEYILCEEEVLIIPLYHFTAGQ
jgi:hypothetical protein